MREPAELPIETIRAGLLDGYGLQAVRIEFLPIGNDATAFVYRVETQAGETYFLKLKRGLLYEASLAVPRYLKEQGIRPVVAPLPDRSGELRKSLDGYSLILYPFIPGATGMETGLSRQQWVEFGAVLKTIHSTRLPAGLEQMVDKETFIPAWSEMVRRLDALIQDVHFNDPLERELSAFWLERQAEILRIVERAGALGRLLQERSPRFVLCHSDIHTANLILDPGGQLFIIDWDHPLFAPPERDLMFVTGDEPKSQAEEWFFHGYGETSIDPLALAYYAYEWVVQEIGDYGERVFLTKDQGEITKKNRCRVSSNCSNLATWSNPPTGQIYLYRIFQSFSSL